MSRSANRTKRVMIIWPWILVLAAMPGCSSDQEEPQPEKSCLEPLYDCFSASGDCLLETDEQDLVMVTWDNGAKVSGPIGLVSFDAESPTGDPCFSRSVEGNQIVISAEGKTYRVDRAQDGSTTVTCPDGFIETWSPDRFPSDAVGIDPGRLTGCRVAGMCNQDSDCPSGDVCCDGRCMTGERCPGTCEVDEHCGTGNKCCDGWCTSLPSCNIPCTTDAQCDDGLYCNGAETCSNVNKCQPAPPVNCDDQMDCTVDSCNEETDRCMAVPDDDLCGAEQMCDPGRGCVDVIRCSSDPDCQDPDPCYAGTCVGDICQFEPVPGCCHEDADCGDGIFCNGREICTGNQCGPGSAPDCLDQHACTADRCDPGRDTCVHTPDDELCEPDEVCSPTEGCTTIEDCNDDQYEDNDFLEEASPLEQATIYVMQLCPGDPDWLVFEAPGGLTSVIALSFQADNSLINPSVVDVAGHEVAERIDTAEGIIIFTYENLGETQDLFLQIWGSIGIPIGYSLYFEAG